MSRKGQEITAPARLLDALEARGRLFRVAPDQHGLGAGAGQPLGHGAAEFPGAPDDDGHLALEGKEGGRGMRGVVHGRRARGKGRNPPVGRRNEEGQ